MPSVGRKLTAVGAYIFAGGFTLGVREHFKVLCHLEEGDYGVKTCQRNMPSLPIHVGPETWPLDDLAKVRPDFVYGNPPCAAWSVAGYGPTRGTDKWKTDPRVNCTRKYFQLLAALEPKVWAWESVTQAYTKGFDFCMDLARQARDLGYSTTFLLHNAKYCGLPQVRKRFFMVCHRVPFYPRPPSFGGEEWGEPPTPVQVLKGVSKEGRLRGSGGWPIKMCTPEVMAKIKPGERLLTYWKREVAGDDPSKWERNSNGSVKGRPSFGHCRLPEDRPGGAVVGYALIHPIEDRFIGPKEMQVLSGFPESYEFTPERGPANASEIARGVCPPVGAWLAGEVKAAIRDGRPVGKPSVILVDYREKPGVITGLSYEDSSPLGTPPELPPPVSVALQEGRKPLRPKGRASERIAPPGPLTPKKKGPREAPARPQGIGSYIRELLREGRHSPDQIIVMVKTRFPESRATVADVAWNRAKLRKEADASR